MELVNDYFKNQYISLTTLIKYQTANQTTLQLETEKYEKIEKMENEKKHFFLFSIFQMQHGKKSGRNLCTAKQEVTKPTKKNFFFQRY